MQELMMFLSNHQTPTLVLAIVLILLMAVEFLRLKRQHYRVNVQKAVYLINRENAIVIDIRPKDLYQKGHIIDAESCPAQEIQTNSKKIEKFKSKPIILVCGAGIESQKIAALLLKQGYNAHSLAGGLRAWIGADLPLVKE